MRQEQNLKSEQIREMWLNKVEKIQTEKLGNISWVFYLYLQKRGL